jgi:hypothetical protein
MSSIGIYDAIDDCIDMIKTKWNNTSGGVVPRVERIWDEKTIGFGDMEISKGIILIEAMDEDVKYFSLYGVDHMHTITLTLDVRSYQTLDRHEVIMKELARIIKDQIRRTSFVDLRIVGTVPLSRLYRNMFRHMIRVTYRKMNP